MIKLNNKSETLLCKQSVCMLSKLESNTIEFGIRENLGGQENLFIYKNKKLRDMDYERLCKCWIEPRTQPLSAEEADRISNIYYSVKVALDEMGKALTDYNHKWTPLQRECYEGAIKVLKKELE